MTEISTIILLNIFKTVCAISMLGNIFALIVFSRKSFQNTIFSTYFRLLTLFDILTILNGIDDLIILSGSDTYWTKSILICKFAYWINYLMPSISSWILSLISIDRCISIARPQKYLFRKKIKFQLIGCLIVILFNCLCFLPIAIDASIYSSNKIINETIVCENHNEASELINSIIGVLIPFLIMFISNIIIIKTIFKSRKNSISSTTPFNNSNNNNNNVLLKDIKFSITSICFNISFFVLNIPLSIYLAFQLVVDLDEDEKKNITISLSIIYYSHYGTLFYVSYLINSLFRNECLNLFQQIKSIFKISINKLIN